MVYLASPSKDRLPTMYGENRSIFCHTCQTNQMLLTNLLSNYLPPPEVSPCVTFTWWQNLMIIVSTSIQTTPVASKCCPITETPFMSDIHLCVTSAYRRSKRRFALKTTWRVQRLWVDGSNKAKGKKNRERSQVLESRGKSLGSSWRLGEYGDAFGPSH